MDYEVIHTDNFFACISRALEDKFKPKVVHDKLLMQFARAMFFNVGECETVAQVLNISSEKLVLNKACYEHPAVKVWIERVHASEPCLHKRAKDWFRIYPKLLKGLARRFLHYHMSYKQKPHRIVCRILFAHLAAELFCCRIGFIQPNGKDKWIYPLDSDDYYIGMNITTIALRYVDDTFELLRPPSLLSFVSDDDLRLVPLTKDEEEEMEQVSFMLRKYAIENMETKLVVGQTHSNVQVGMFKALSQHVHVIYYTPLSTTEDIMYQIYPGNEEKTFYTLPYACSLFVYRAVNKPGAKELLQTSLIAHTDSFDHYIYFYLPADTIAILVVCAKNAKEAEALLLSQTTFTTTN